MCALPRLKEKYAQQEKDLRKALQDLTELEGGLTQAIAAVKDSEDALARKQYWGGWLFRQEGFGSVMFRIRLGSSGDQFRS